MTKINANRFWPQLQINFGGTRGRIPMGGWISAEFQTKVIASNGNSTQKWRSRRSGTTFSASATEAVTDGGMRLQTYWKFQYQLDIGGLAAVARRIGLRRGLPSEVRGLYNIIQTFDVLPGRGRSREYDVTFRRVRGDRRGGAMSMFEFSAPNQNRSISYSRNLASISTSCELSLPINFSGSFSQEISAEIGAEISIEPAGVGVAASASVGTATGASIDLSFRRTLSTRLLGEVTLALPS